LMGLGMGEMGVDAVKTKDEMNDEEKRRGERFVARRVDFNLSPETGDLGPELSVQELLP
jgi:hypothetical protein